MNILLSFNANTETRLYKLCDMLDSTRSEKGLRKYGIKHQYATNGSIRAVIGALRNRLSKYDKKLLLLIRGHYTDIADAMDAAQDVLDPVFDAVERFVLSETSRKTCSTPDEPVLLAQCISCLIFLDMSSTLFDDITSENNFHELNSDNAYIFLRMNQLYEQLKKIVLYLPWTDTDGDPLHFNMDSVIRSEAVAESLKDIFYMVYSAEFADIILEARGGIETKFSEHFKSFVDRFVPDTLTIEEYKLKYINKQWTSHSQAS